MAPRRSGQTSIFGVVFFVSKSLLGIEGQGEREKFVILTRKPQSHAQILIYRTWPIEGNIKFLTRKPRSRVRIYEDIELGLLYGKLIPGRELIRLKNGRMRTQDLGI